MFGLGDYYPTFSWAHTRAIIGWTFTLGAIVVGLIHLFN